MSWYVGFLLRNSIEIKDNFNLDDTLCNDLLDVERLLSILIKKNMITDEEKEILDIIRSNPGISFGRLSKVYGISKYVLAKRFNDICDRISFFLGGRFNDYGFVGYITNKYNLNDKQIKTLCDFIHNEEIDLYE